MIRKHVLQIGLLVCVLIGIVAEVAHQISKSQISPEQAILAQVGDKRITVSDLETHFYAMRPGSQRYYATIKNRQILLYYMVCDKLCALFAEKNGYDRQPSVRARLQQVLRDSPPERRSWDRDLILAKLVQDRFFKSELTVSYSEARRYYNFHKESYENAFLIEASRIYLPTKYDLVEAQRRLARGVSFESVAKLMSRDQFAGPGGHMKPFLVGKKPSLDEGILLGMRIGQISPAIEEDSGYVLLKLNALKPVTFEVARPFIEDALQREKLNSWTKLQWERAQVVVDEKLLASLELRPPR